MPRIRVEPPVSIPAFQDPDDEKGETLDDALSSTKGKPKRKRSGFTPSRIERAFKEFDELFKGSRWKTDPSKIRPEHAIAFYVRLHVKVYSTKDPTTGKIIEVYPEELRGGQTWLHACAAIKRMIEGDKRQFDDGAGLFEFVLWTWRKESDRVKWLRDNDKPIHKRITWRDQFILGYKLTEYRQAIAEERERGKRR
jgi:hypothetical protein